MLGVNNLTKVKIEFQENNTKSATTVIWGDAKAATWMFMGYPIKGLESIIYGISQ